MNSGLSAQENLSTTSSAGFNSPLGGAGFANQTAAGGGGAIGLGGNGLSAAGNTAVSTATTAGIASPLGGAALSTQAAATNTAAASFLHNEGATLGGQSSVGTAFGGHTNAEVAAPIVNANVGGHTNVAAGATAGAGGNADFLNHEATTLGAHSSVQAAGATTAAVSAGPVSVSGNTAAHNSFGTHADILGQDSASLGGHSTVASSGGVVTHTPANQGNVIQTGGSATGGGEVASGSHGTSVITGAQGSSAASGATSVGADHASANVDQHGALESSTHVATPTPDHSALDQSSHAATDYSSHSLFDTSHDPSASHAQAATDLASHNQFDQHMGF